MTKPDERCAWCNNPTAWYKWMDWWWEDTTKDKPREYWFAEYPCSCNFLTLPKREGSKSEIGKHKSGMALWFQDVTPYTTNRR